MRIRTDLVGEGHMYILHVLSAFVGPGTNKSAKELTRTGRTKMFVTLVRQGIEPRVFGFEFRRTYQ